MSEPNFDILNESQLRTVDQMCSKIRVTIPAWDLIALRDANIVSEDSDGVVRLRPGVAKSWKWWKEDNAGDPAR